ncbi:MAG TPA: hypothetical protein PLQ89_09470 [Phycisphaerae bacterium]|nr:hypothetical protein [Phycisphaerae bacterium]HOJ75178.1 hypothetical protein [Phycisphaerae bacterium]HOQ85936.1 hypothetical protein [Phycisphaerae bacterium]
MLASPSETLRGGLRLAGAILLLAALTALLQGRSVGYGLVLDDYNHRAELRDGDWSFRSLVDASHLGDPRRRVRMWWQDEADLYFFRPVAFAIMRATYVAGGWRPDVMHVASLGWGVVCTSLVLLLARRATGSTGWGLLAAVLFLMHPNNFLTPRWIACQNEQMATAFTLAALLCYGRYAGWWEPSRKTHNILDAQLWCTLPACTRRQDACTTMASAAFRQPPDGSPSPRSRRSHLFLAATLSCYVAALGCRESAIVLPALLVLGDLVTAKGAGLRRRLAAYAAFALIAVGYLVLRRAMLGPLTIPGRPYAWPASEPGFVTFVVEKFVYYILGLWAYLPIVGFAGQAQMRAHPGLFYGLFACIVLGWALIITVVRPNRSIWLWLGLAILPLAPVLPVFASAHHLYLVSAGMAVATVLAIRSILWWSRQRADAWRRIIRGAIVTLIPLHLAAFAGVNFVLDTGVAGLAAACQLPIRQAIQLGRPMQAGDRLFFINLPMLAFNCIPAIEEARGVAPLHGYVLTFAPEFLYMDRPAHVEQVDAHRLRVWLDEPAYFSGLIGRSILQGIQRDAPFRAGETFATEEFTVEVTRADATGVQEFLFTFNRPLSDPTYHFFLASPTFDAYPLAFR